MSRAEEQQGTQDDEVEFDFLGMFGTVIVGIRYYTGRVGINELVKFIREPDNAYDANVSFIAAVAVMLQESQAEQVVPADALIAPLLDNGSLRIEGVMP
eukprot:gene10723-10880_t